MLCSRVSSPMPWLTFPSDPDRALDVLLAPRTSHYCGRQSDGEVAELVVGSNHRHAAPGPRRTEGSPRRRAGFVGMLGSHLIPPAQRASCGRSAGTHAK
jgi:hypothetical protein